MVDLGILQLDEDERVIGYVEKPEQTHDVSMPLHPNLDPGTIEEIAGILVDAAPVSAGAVSSARR